MAEMLKGFSGALYHLRRALPSSALSKFHWCMPMPFSSSAFKNMMALTRPCRWAVIELYENEAELEKGMGMHQWNFDKAEDGSARLRWYKAPEKPFNISAIMLENGASE